MAGVKGRSGGPRANSGGARENSGPKPALLEADADDAMEFLRQVMREKGAPAALAPTRGFFIFRDFFK
jgi:hypothetical protein